ncbi:MAG: hypothetical protein ACOYOE_08960 [Chlorobium sp.]
MQNIHPPQQVAPAIQRHQQRFLSTDQALQYIKDVYGITVAKATLYKKRSVEKGAFIGQRSPFGKLVFSPAEIDLYLATGSARETVQHEEVPA